MVSPTIAYLPDLAYHTVFSFTLGSASLCRDFDDLKKWHATSAQPFLERMDLYKELRFELREGNNDSVVRWDNEDIADLRSSTPDSVAWVDGDI